MHHAQLHPKELGNILIRLQLIATEVRRHNRATPACQHSRRHTLAFDPLAKTQVFLHAAKQVKRRLGVTRFPTFHCAFLHRLQIYPPRLQLPTERHRPELHPLAEHVRLDRVRVGVAIAARAAPLRETHVEASSHEPRWRRHIARFHRRPCLRRNLLQRLRVQELTVPHLRRVPFPEFLLGLHDVEHTVLRVVPQVHGLIHGTPLPPRQHFPSWQHHVLKEIGPRHQRRRELPQVVPAHLQAFDRFPVLDVPRQHEHQLPHHVLRVPRHLHARRHVLHSLQPFLVRKPIVLDRDETHINNPPHGGWEHQVPLLVDGEPPQLLLGRIARNLRRPLHVLPRTSPRVHTVVDRVTLEQAVPPRERCEVLRKRDAILLELPQAGPLHRHVIHLHVLQRHQHRLHHGRVPEELAQFLVRKVPAGVHAILHAS